MKRAIMPATAPLTGYILLFPVLFFLVFRPLPRQIKELQQAEKELERTQAILQDALRVKSEFMNNVTHQLRTPLNSVIGFAELLRDEVPGPLNAQQAEFAADILASGQHLLRAGEGDSGNVAARCGRARAGGALEIAVTDTGFGIAREALAKLFKPLTQLDAGVARKHGGLGLGLALAHRLAALHGGTIEVESEPGEGGTFTLRLPIERHS